MATPFVMSLAIESIVFPPTMKAPGSTNNFFLGSAGVRGIQIQDKFVKFTAIGVYLQDIAIPYLAAKWKGKPPHKLTESVPFFMDIVTGRYLSHCHGHFYKFNHRWYILVSYPCMSIKNNDNNNFPHSRLIIIPETMIKFTKINAWI